MTNSRIVVAYLFVIAVISILLIRYANLQIYGYEKFLNQAVDNYSSIVSTKPVRGAIIDSESTVLADNQISYAVAILPKDAKNIESVFTELDQQINLTSFDKRKYFKQLKISKKYDWVVIKDSLSNIEIANLTAHRYLFPELNVFAYTKRYYPFQDLYAHSIGYVGRVSQHDKTNLGDKGVLSNYSSNDYIGKAGLEEEYESILRGSLGKKIIQTDAFGNEVGLVSNNPATDGHTIQLTINNHLQQKASQLLGNRKGAIVALDPKTGGVLVFVSKPSYDANLFLDGISPSEWDDLRQDTNNPLLNRASQGTYPPGSTFKPFLAASALYLGVRNSQYRFHDIGYFAIPGSSHRFRNSGNEVLGTIGIVDAVAHSSDAFFFKLGLDMGVDRMDKTLPMFGLGSKTGIDLPEENTGLLPSRKWKAQRFKNNPSQENWLPADSVTMGIGQGFNHYTPLQMANAVTILANNGVVKHPHFLSRIMDKSGNVIYDYPSESSTRIPISRSDLDLIKLGMQRAMKIGTGARIGAGTKYTIAGKTGTAQVVALQQNSRKSKFSGDKYKDHSWFIAFAPVENPKIAIAVIVENGGFGATSAGPIVRGLFDTYLLPAESSVPQVKYKKFNPLKANTSNVVKGDINNNEDIDDSDNQGVDDGT